MERLTEYGVLISLRHKALWLPMLLGVTGGVALLAGIFVAVTTPMKELRSPSLPLHGAIYVGANTCYTCHNDESGGGSLARSPQVFDNPLPVVARPQTGDEVQQINMDDMAYTTEEFPAQVGSSNPQRYVLRTEGGHTLLPSQWDSSELGISKPDEAAIRCGDCHAASRSSPYPQTAARLRVSRWNNGPFWAASAPGYRLKMLF
jgi:cytochrome c553